MTFDELRILGEKIAGPRSFSHFTEGGAIDQFRRFFPLLVDLAENYEVGGVRQGNWVKAGQAACALYDAMSSKCPTCGKPS